MGNTAMMLLICVLKAFRAVVTDARVGIGVAGTRGRGEAVIVIGPIGVPAFKILLSWKREDVIGSLSLFMRVPFWVR